VRRSRLAGLAALAAAPLALFAAALPVEIGARGWLGAGLPLLLLGALLAATVAAAAPYGRVARLAAGSLAGGVIAAHARELFGEPRSTLAAAATIALLGVLLALLARAFDHPVRAKPRAFAALALAAALPASVALASRDGAARLVLLRHARLLGTPLALATGGDVVAAAQRRQDEPAAPPPAAGEGRPPIQRGAHARSVVLVVVDTLRADALAPWGGEEELPAFDALAREGWVLADVRADSSWTKASVASIFTGLSPEAHGVRALAHALEERHRTLAERFREAGYRTAGFSANVAQIHAAAGFAQGFDEFATLEGGAEPYARAPRVRRAVERWLAGVEPGGPPVFLYVHLLDPHEPYLSGETSRLAVPRLRRAAYAAEVRTVDRELGPLVAALRERLDDPVFVVASDHGEELGDHGGFGHGATLLREVVVIPVLVAGAGGAGRLDARLSGRDLYDLLPRFAAGPVDVAAWARSHDRETRRSSLHFRWPRMPLHRPYLRVTDAVRIEDGRFALVRTVYGDTRELYDLVADPAERRNLAARLPDEVARLERLLAATEPRWSPPGAPHDLGPAAAHLRALGYL
jgi:arylsulfatase A-like enzyme